MERTRYIPVIVAPRYQLRVEDLGPADFLHARCDVCRRVALIPAAELAARRKGYERMLHVARDIRCQRCPPGSPMSWSIYREI